jgi:hypothetical protein
MGMRRRKAMYEDDEKDDGKDQRNRDDLIEAGRKLRKEMESRESNLGVKARKQAWKARKGKRA